MRKQNPTFWRPG